MITNDNPHSISVAGGVVRVCYWLRGETTSTASDRDEATHAEVELGGHYMQLEFEREPNKHNPWYNLDKMIKICEGAFERGKLVKLKELRDFLGIKERGLF